MPRGTCQIALNGRETWAYVVEMAEAMRVHLSIDDWERLNFAEGQRIPVRLTIQWCPSASADMRRHHSFP